MMDIIEQRMLASHWMWYKACRWAFGPEAGAIMYLATARFMEGSKS